MQLIKKAKRNSQVSGMKKELRPPTHEAVSEKLRHAFLWGRASPYRKKSGWWFQIFFCFTPISGQMIQFWNGLLQPPTSTDENQFLGSVSLEPLKAEAQEVWVWGSNLTRIPHVKGMHLTPLKGWKCWPPTIRDPVGSWRLNHLGFSLDNEVWSSWPTWWCKVLNLAVRVGLGGG